MEGTDEYARRTERIKNLLSSYYGNEGGGEGQHAAAEAAAGESFSPAASKGSFSIPIPAMDSPAFNADKHIAQMLKSFTLEKMMSEHHNMAREIKNLDSDMQQLVYENYNKFIAATDTIRTMKTNVDGMGGDMERLRTIIGARRAARERWGRAARRRPHACRQAGACRPPAAAAGRAARARGPLDRPLSGQLPRLQPPPAPTLPPAARPRRQRG
jgi:hypothetical protein